MYTDIIVRIYHIYVGIFIHYIVINIVLLIRYYHVGRLDLSVGIEMRRKHISFINGNIEMKVQVSCGT